MKWYLQNAARRAQHAIKNPGYAIKTVFRELTFADERFLARATGSSATQIRAFLREPFQSPEFMNHLRKSEPEFNAGFASADLWAKKVLVQYAAVRALRPEIIVETGVASGVSSSYLLLALERNQTGKLYSVEIGDKTYLPAGKEPGWIVPNALRSRWTMHIGDSAAILPGLLEELRPIDIFIHDSLHTYDQMKFKFNLARPYIRRNGLLFADDALWNNAFNEFAQEVKSPVAEIIRGRRFYPCLGPMKILIYTHAFAPMIGGLETTVMTLAKGLGERGAGLEVIVATRAPGKGADEAEKPFRVVRQPGFLVLLGLIRNADVVHLAGPVLLPMFLALLWRKPVVVEHDIYQAACPNGLLLDERTRTVCPNHFLAGRPLECVRCNRRKVGLGKSIAMVMTAYPRRWLCARMTRNIYPSRHVGLRVGLPNGINIFHGTPEPTVNPAPQQSTGSPPCFAFIGRLVPEKGVSVILRAGEILAREGRDFRLKIVGDGPERHSLEEMARHCNLDGRVEFTGALRGAALDAALSGSTASLMPSTWEDVAPLAAIEHLMAGRLLIASDIGGLGELVGDAGLRFPPGDAEALAGCLRRVLDDPELAPRFRQKARERALQLFSEERTIAEHLSLYQELAPPQFSSVAPVQAG